MDGWQAHSGAREGMLGSILQAQAKGSPRKCNMGSWRGPGAPEGYRRRKGRARVGSRDTASCHTGLSQSDLGRGPLCYVTSSKTLPRL